MASRPPTREEIESVIGQRVYDLELFQRAFVHKSAARHFDGKTQESLELLGDAALGLTVCQLLLDEYADKDEGFISRMRIRIVNGKTLAMFATTLDLSRYIVVSTNARAIGAHLKPRILEDTFESICGALMQDAGGLTSVRQFVKRVLLMHPNFLDALVHDSNHKDVLSKYALREGLAPPEYETAVLEGPAHARVFKSTVTVGGMTHEGSGASKKCAEMCAAEAALTFLGVSSEFK